MVSTPTPVRITSASSKCAAAAFDDEGLLPSPRGLRRASAIHAVVIPGELVFVGLQDGLEATRAAEQPGSDAAEQAELDEPVEGQGHQREGQRGAGGDLTATRTPET